MIKVSADTLSASADRKPNVVFIGIAGGTGSGKTTLADKIREAFGEDVALISHDSYYRAQDEKTPEERARQNYDHPDAFENDLLCADLDRLAKWQTVRVPVYDYTQHNRSKEVTVVEPKRVILLEGILIFSEPAIRDRMNLRIFVDTDADERVMRRIERDTKTRARTVESIIRQIRETVKPMHEAFVEPSKRYADIIVPGGGENEAALGMITSHIRQLLNC